MIRDGAYGQIEDWTDPPHACGLGPETGHWDADRGVLYSLTGTMAYSEARWSMPHCCADEINHRGGLLGRCVEALVVDGKSNAAAFASSAQWLLGERGVSAIFGWMSGTASGLCRC